jgi:hypothetical protein
LTDLTFIEDGIPSVIKRTNLINFAKRAKTAEVISDIQQYQNVPYPLQPVTELQDYILSNMQAAGDVHEMYDRSLLIEPREREDEKIARYGNTNSRNNSPPSSPSSASSSLSGFGFGFGFSSRGFSGLVANVKIDLGVLQPSSPFKNDFPKRVVETGHDKIFVDGMVLHGCGSMMM